MTFGIGQRGEGAALIGANVMAQHGHAAQMRLVDDGARPRNVGRTIVAPVEDVVGHDGLQHARRAVAPIVREIGPRRIDAIAEQRIGPAQRSGEPPRIRIEQQLVRIEAVSVLRADRVRRRDSRRSGRSARSADSRARFRRCIPADRGARSRGGRPDRTGKARCARHARRTPRNWCPGRPRWRRADRACRDRVVPAMTPSNYPSCRR